MQNSGSPYANAPVYHAQKKYITDGEGWFSTKLATGDTLVIVGKKYVVNVIPFVFTLPQKVKGLELPEVSVTGYYNKTCERIELNKDDISRLKGSSNTELFNNMPGVQLNNIRNEAGALDIGIRGLQGEGRVPVLIDGGLQSTQTLRGYQGTSDRTYIDMNLIKKVKVDKGAAFCPHAIGATGGVVTLSTIDAEDVVMSTKKVGLMVKGNIFNNNKQPNIPKSEIGQQYYVLQNDIKEQQFNGFNATAALAYKGDKLDFLAAYSRRQDGNYFSGKKGGHRYGYNPEYYDTPNNSRPGHYKNPAVRPGQEVVNTSYNSQSILAKAGWAIAPHHRIEANFRYHTQQAGEVLIAYWFKNNTDSSRKPLAKGVESMPQWSLGTAKIYANILRYKFNPNSKIDLNVSAFDNITNLHQHNGLAQTIGASYGNQYLHKFKNLRRGLTVYNTTTFDSLALVLKYGVITQLERTTPLEVPQGRAGSARHGKRSENSAFVSATYVWKKITMQADLKAHQAKVHDYNDTTKLKYGINTDYSGKLAYAPFEWLRLMAKGSKTLRSPSLFESAKSLQVFSYDDRYPLTPEATIGYEFGAQATFVKVLTSTDKLSFGGGWFYNNTKKYISTAVLLPDYDFVFLNYDKFRLKGIDLNCSYTSLVAFVEASAVFYNDALVCSEIMGKSNGVESCNTQGFDWSVLPNRIPPKKTFLVTAGIYAFDRKLSLGGSFRYHNRKENPKNWLAGTGAVGVAVSLPQDHQIGLFGSYRHNQKLALNVNVDNLTDRYMFDVGSVIKMPVPGRAIRIGVEVNL